MSARSPQFSIRAFLHPKPLSRCRPISCNSRPTLHKTYRPSRVYSTRGSSLLRLTQQTKSLRSGISVSALLGGLAVSFASLYLWTTFFDQTSTSNQLSDPIPEEKNLDDSSSIPWIRVYPGMPTQIPPGRPGNLTKEQEAKLKELWEALMNIFGTWPADVEPVASAPIEAPAPEQSGSAKKKHRFGGLLRGKKQADEAEPSGADSNVEDKHGQNKEFKQALVDQSPGELRDNFWMFSKGDDPDALLLRFLRARKWVVHDALVMLVSTIHWRGSVMHLDDDIMKQGEGGALEAARTGSGQDKKVGEDFLTQLRLGKSFLHGTDRDGRPVCFARVKLHRQGEQCEAAIERCTVYTIETARLLLRPQVDTAVILFDMTDFSMANMDYAPVKFMIKVFEANYPECLGVVIVHKAPWIFQGIWTIIRGWLDPVVASKVHFTKTTNDLAEFIDIKHIPKDMGGQEDWEYKYVEPQDDENSKMKDTAKRQEIESERARLVKDYEAATVEWTRGPNAVQSKRTALAEGLRHNYWKLDPYVRARSLCDRTGMIQPGGVLQFYPDESNGKTTPASGSSMTRASVDSKNLYYDARQEHTQDDID